jgi:hypothetical protein
MTETALSGILPDTEFPEALARNKEFFPLERRVSGVVSFSVPGFEPNSPPQRAVRFHSPVCLGAVPAGVNAPLLDQEKEFGSFACIHVTHGSRSGKSG